MPQPILIRNCSAVVSGAIAEPLVADADSVLVGDGKILAVGRALEAPDGAGTIDARGHVLAPGFIDSHVHPSFDDWSGRVNSFQWPDAYREAGVTSAISQGAFNIAGYPDDRVGGIALAVVLSYADQARPANAMKLVSATVSLTDDMTAGDFRQLHDCGVWLISEVGVRGSREPSVVAGLLRLAHFEGFVSRVHVGPGSMRGSASIGVDDVLTMKPTIASHINGGPIAPPLDEIGRLIDESDAWLELCYAGNLKAFVFAAKRARSQDKSSRLLIGSDTPSGTGMTPRAVLRACAWLASLADFSPAASIAVATGNNASAHRLNRGFIAAGKEADLVLLDSPRGSQWANALDALAGGDIPAVSLVMIDGAVTSSPARNSPYGRTPLVDPVAL